MIDPFLGKEKQDRVYGGCLLKSLEGMQDQGFTRKREKLLREGGPYPHSHASRYDQGNCFHRTVFKNSYIPTSKTNNRPRIFPEPMERVKLLLEELSIRYIPLKRKDN
jgi:hypothetical protein